MQMLDNGHYLQQLLSGIQYQLLDIDTLEPSQFVQRLLCFACNGIEQGLCMIVRQAIHQFKTQRAIMKYIYIIDKLLKIPNFILAIQNSIIDIYNDLFMFLLMQKCNNQIEQLKILRKYWVGTLHSYILKQIKDLIFQRTNIDIDAGFKQETINRIRTYYQTKLNMGPEDLAMHLPSAHKQNQPFKHNIFEVQTAQASQIYLTTQKIIYPQNYNMNYNQIHYSNPNIYNHQYSHSIPAQPSYPPKNAIHSINAQIQQEDMKRKRLASQETRAAVAGGSAFEGVQPKPRKIQHPNQVIIDYKFMLSKLKKMNPFTCRECGIQLMTSENHQSHKNEHIKQKLTKTDKIRSVKPVNLCSVDQWVNNKQDKLFTYDKFCISIPIQMIGQRLCDFCCSEFDMQIRNDQWVYVNATTVKINNQQCIMHKHCQVALEASSDEEDIQDH